MTRLARIRLFGACVSVSLWLLLLFMGVAPSGVVHLLLMGALLLFPWRALPPPTDEIEVDAEPLTKDQS